MKEKMLYRLWLFAGLLVSLALVTACAPAAKKKMDAPKMAEPDMVYEAGIYKNKALGITLTWPKDILSVKDPLSVKTEVVRVRADNAYKVPVLTLNIVDKTKDAKPISDVEGVANDYAKGLEESQASTNSKRFKLRESKAVTLANGMQAVYSMVTWKWGGTFGLVTVNLTIYKGDQSINVSVTSVPGQPPVEVISKWIEAIVVDP